MAQSASVAKLSVRHDAILHFLIANPTIPKREVALRFNVTEAWLSVVCNSQAFLEARARLTEEVFHETVLPMREKMIAAADKALDRMNELIPVETDLDKIRKSAGDVLAACGYGAPRPGPGVQQNTQINNYFGNASAEVLARARDRIGKRELEHEPEPPRPIGEHFRIPDASRGREREDASPVAEEGGGDNLNNPDSHDRNSLVDGTASHGSNGSTGGAPGVPGGTGEHPEGTGDSKRDVGVDETRPASSSYPGINAADIQLAGARVSDSRRVEAGSELPNKLVEIRLHGSGW